MIKNDSKKSAVKDYMTTNRKSAESSFYLFLKYNEKKHEYTVSKT